MADSEFRLPSSSFQEISKIIQAYAQINRPSSLDDIAKRTGINTTTISGNNGFLLSLGIIEGGKRKGATLAGKKLGDALGHGLEDEVRQIFRDIAEESEFLKNILGAIRIRRGMEESALRSHIAYSAGAGKSPSVTTGSGAVIELLIRSGTIKEEEGKYIITTTEAASFSEASPTQAVQQPASSVERLFPIQTQSASGINLSIVVKINCTPDDIEGLGEKLKKIVSDFKSNSQEE